MQNEFGCIKIGRSIDPWQRRSHLQQSEHCKIELVAAFDGGGEDEEMVHFGLHSFRLEGEWFDGSKKARKAVEMILGVGSDDWKFSHDRLGAAKWLEHLRVVRNSNYIRRSLTRQIGMLRTATGPSWVHDGGIFWCAHLATTGNRIVISVEDLNGQTVNIWNNPVSEEREVLPAYTATVENALLAWPEDLRPESWGGTPIQCCIAALVEIRAGLPKVERFKRIG